MLIGKTILAVIDVLIAVLILNVSLKEKERKYAIVGSVMAVAYIVTAILMYV